MSGKAIKTVIIILLCMLLFLFLMALVICEERREYPKKYSDIVEKYSSEFSVPEQIVYSVIKVESDFVRDATSGSGACGLMQLMPSTYEWLVELRGEEIKEIYNEDENIKYGTFYLSLLYEKYKDWTLTLCAYNAGPTNVDSWLEREPFEIALGQTKNYVNKIKVANGRYSALYYG